MKLTAIMMSLFAVVATVGANAATSAASDMQQHEVIFNATRATGGSLQFGGQATGADSRTHFGLQGGYNYHVLPGIQVGLQSFGIDYASQSGNSQTNWDFLAGVTLNWPMTDRLENAFFLAVGAGLQHTGAVGPIASNSSFQFGAEVGKRFTLAEHFNYRPSVSFLKVKDTSALIAINFLAFSATF